MSDWTTSRQLDSCWICTFLVVCNSRIRYVYTGFTVYNKYVYASNKGHRYTRIDVGISLTDNGELPLQLVDGQSDLVKVKEVHPEEPEIEPHFAAASSDEEQGQKNLFDKVRYTTPRLFLRKNT